MSSHVPDPMHTAGKWFEEIEEQRGGVVVVAGECRNQHGELVAEGEGKMLVHMRP